MTETEQNRDIIQRALDAWRAGSGAITDIFANDMVWRIEGHSVVSRE
jgi:ketosteroid isomerase-like protein